MVRATCRSRRATRWRSTAEPTGLAMISPTRGPLPVSLLLPRLTFTTMSGCTVRSPYFSVASNSADRLMRLRAGSTAKPGVAIRQIARGGPCDAGRRRSNVQRECASADGNRARGLGAGCSAGRSACPWPRDSPRRIELKRSEPSGRSCFASTSVGGGLAAGRRGPQAHHPGSQPYRRLSGDCLRVLTSVRWVKPGPTPTETWLSPTDPLEHLGKRLAPTRGTQAIFPVTEIHRKRTGLNATELLAAGRKTVSFSQCRFRLERWSTTKRGWRID
jgi:hypothetical protein